MRKLFLIALAVGLLAGMVAYIFFGSSASAQLNSSDSPKGQYECTGHETSGAVQISAPIQLGHCKVLTKRLVPLFV